MKKNISLAQALLLLPLLAPSALLSMEKEQPESTKNSMAESVMVTTIPTKRGLGFVRSTFDFIWNEEENLYSDLETGKFDPENSSYHHKLDTALQIYTTKENTERITGILRMCITKHPKQIKIGDGQACMVHQLLAAENKEKQVALAKTIKTNDNEFINKMNILLAGLKESVHTKILEMQNLRNAYLSADGERNALINRQCNEIRDLKCALANTHKLNKTFVLPKNTDDGYCSDDEKDIKNPANIENSYNNQRILEKIHMTSSMQHTTDKTEELLCLLVDSFSKLNTIKQIER
jgi:hypothetical protein